MNEAGKIDEQNPGILVKVNDFVFTARYIHWLRGLQFRPFDDTPKHEMAFNMLQRRCAGLALNSEIEACVFREEDIKVTSTISFEVDLLQKNNTGKVQFVECG